MKDRKIVSMTDKKYSDYLVDHIGNVRKGFRWMLDHAMIDDEDGKLAAQIDAHDESKYGDDEWDAYRDYFYANGPEEQFNYSWLHHIHANPHHWQHWMLINDDGNLDDEGKMTALAMPDNYIIEMICDWWAFSWSKGNLREIFNWYEEHKGGIMLHPETETKVMSLFDTMKDILDTEEPEENSKR